MFYSFYNLIWFLEHMYTEDPQMGQLLVVLIFPEQM